MEGAGMRGGVGQLVLHGRLILAVPVAAAAGAITFISPCCLPLVPGYLSYVTGMAGADAEGTGARARPPRAAGDDRPSGPRQGTALTAATPRATTAARGATAARLVAPGATVGTPAAPSRGRALSGTALFVLGFSALFASYGAAFGGLGEVLLAHQRGLIQVLGAVTILLGLLFAAVFRKGMRGFGFGRRHAALVTRVGGAMLVAVGVLQVTGAWTVALTWLRVHWIGGYELPL